MISLVFCRYNPKIMIINCLRCRSLVIVRSDGCRAFILGPCQALGSALDRPVPVTFEKLVVGRQEVHSTHKVYTYKGLMYCRKCGGHAGTGHIIQKLSKICKPVDSLPSSKGRWGRAVIDAIQNGELPRGLSRWPCQLDGN